MVINIYQCHYLRCYMFFPWQHRKQTWPPAYTAQPGGTRVNGMFCKWKQANINPSILLTQVGTPVIDLHENLWY